MLNVYMRALNTNCQTSDKHQQQAIPISHNGRFAQHMLPPKKYTANTCPHHFAPGINLICCQAVERSSFTSLASKQDLPRLASGSSLECVQTWLMAAMLSPPHSNRNNLLSPWIGHHERRKKGRRTLRSHHFKTNSDWQNKSPAPNLMFLGRILSCRPQITYKSNGFKQ